MLRSARCARLEAYATSTKLRSHCHREERELPDATGTLGGPIGSPRPVECALVAAGHRVAGGRYFSVEPILLLGQRQPRGLHPLVAEEGRIALCRFGKV